MSPPRSHTKEQAEVRFQELSLQLNPEQKRAVDAIEGTVMVLAGPGTGKTQLLAMRIANILQRTQMDPWNILCVTFTESAVAAMRERLVSIIGEAAYYVRIHTFHSFCNEIIQEHPELFAVAEQWQPLSDVERVELLESLLKGLPGTSPLKVFGQPYFYIRDIGSHLQSLKQEHVSPAEFRQVVCKIEQFVAAGGPAADDFFALKASLRTDGQCEEIITHLATVAEQADIPPSMQQFIADAGAEFHEEQTEATDKRAAGKVRTAFKNKIKRWFTKTARDSKAQQAFADVYEQYQEQLLARGRYDYEDMINQVIAVFASNAELLADYQEQFQYILVDEYQDTNGAQNELIRLLGSFDSQPNICVVGDDKQSIYRFQGASLNNMLDFYELYRDHVEIVTLRQNYRSQPLILTAVDAVISHNVESLTKYIPGVTGTLTPATSRRPEPLSVWELPSTQEEEYEVARRIERLIESGVAPHDIAVIVRYHRDSPGIFKALRQLNLPVRLEAGEDALTVPLVQQFLTLLHFIHNIQRDELLAQIISFKWLKLPELDALKILHYAGTERRPLWSVLDSEHNLKAAGVSSPAPWQAFVHRVAQWRALQANTSLQNFLSILLAESGLLDYLLQTTTGPQNLLAMRRLLDEARTQETSVSLGEWLAAVERLRFHGLSLMTRPDQVSTNAVRVMTAHKAKGLEFEHVFLLRVVDKHWGNNPSPARLSLPAGLVRHDRIAGQANNEDERRLFYVAVTRAKQSVVLSYAQQNEQGHAGVPSLFLQELPGEVVAEQKFTSDATAAQERLVSSLSPMPAPTSGETAAWVKTHLNHYVMSVTHLTNYLTCPRMFYVRNILQVPTVRTVYQALGTAVHAALDDWLHYYQRDGAAPTKEIILAAFERHLQREVLSAAERRDITDVGRNFLGAYFDHYTRSFNPHAMSEFDFSTHGVRVGAAAITGKIDKIEWLDEHKKTVNVVDYKTGQPDGKAAALRPGGDYHRQIVFYKLLCDTSPRFPYTMVSGEIDFVQPNRRGQFIKKRIEVTPADLAELTETIGRVWQEIQGLTFLDPATWCGECEYCTY